MSEPAWVFTDAIERGAWELANGLGRRNQAIRDAHTHGKLSVQSIADAAGLTRQAVYNILKKEDQNV